MRQLLEDVRLTLTALQLTDVTVLVKAADAVIAAKGSQPYVPYVRSRHNQSTNTHPLLLLVPSHVWCQC